MIHRKSANLQAHLDRSLRKPWKSFRKRLERCQGEFSEKAVHELRVETRRLLAKLDLLQQLESGGQADAACGFLKKFLDAFDPLRDTQVQALFIHAKLRQFPELDKFHNWLDRRESRLAKRIGKGIQRANIGGLRKAMAAVRNQIRSKFVKPRVAEKQLAAVRKGVDRAFTRVTELAGQIDPRDTATIHRTRVAFKKFRYMVESLQPLLPGVTRRQLRKMHAYQTRMGDIQDVEVRLTILDEFAKEKRGQAAALRRFRNQQIRRRAALVRAYLNVAEEVFHFWPVRENRARTPRRSP